MKFIKLKDFSEEEGISQRILKKYYPDCIMRAGHQTYIDPEKLEKAMPNRATINVTKKSTGAKPLGTINYQIKKLDAKIDLEIVDLKGKEKQVDLAKEGPEKNMLLLDFLKSNVEHEKNKIKRSDLAQLRDDHLAIELAKLES